MVTTRITINEIKSQLLSELSDEVDKLQKRDSLLSHLADWHIPNNLNIKEEVDETVDDYFDCEGIYIVEYDDCDNLPLVLSQYFNHEPPFGKDKKKSEFPDAFVLAGLEHFSRENDDCEDKDEYRYVLLSLDKDMLTYKSERLYIPDFKEYIDSVLSDDKNKDVYLDVIKRSEQQINSNIKKQLVRLLHEAGLYYRILKVKQVVRLDLKEYKSFLRFSASLVSNNNDEMMLFELQSRLLFYGTIYYQIDDDDMIYQYPLNVDAYLPINAGVNKKNQEVCSSFVDPAEVYDCVAKAIYNHSVSFKQ